MAAKRTSPIPAERIERSILLLRGHRIILDSELAALYGVTTGRLNEQVKRNIDRFPPDFMFQTTVEEWNDLKSQFAISSVHGGRRTLPTVFTEHGAIMAAGVLNSTRAVQTSIYVVRAFVRLRQVLATHADLARKLEELERRYDSQFRILFDAIRELMQPPPDPPRRRIGFATEPEGKLRRAKQ